MKRFAVLTLALVLVLSACVAPTPRIDAAQLGEIRSGQTTVDEVVRRFGMPSVRATNPNGTQFATYVHADPGGDPARLVPLVAGQSRDSITFHFDAHGILTDIKTTQRTPHSFEARSAESSPLESRTQLEPAAGGSRPGPAEAKRPAQTGSGAQTRSRPWWLPELRPGTPTTENR